LRTWYNEITDNGQITLLGLLNLSVAFDTVDHVTLLDCLHVSAGVNGTVLSWFLSYLSSRSARVSWNGITSDPVFLEHGVPQGSVLGPLLFLIYTIGINKIFICYNFNVHMYADEIQAYAHYIPSEQSKVVHRTQECAIELLNHVSSRRFRINPKETDFIWLGLKINLFKVTEHSIDLFGNILLQFPTVRSLGVTLEPFVSSIPHISRLSSMCLFQLSSCLCYLTIGLL